MRCPEMVMAKLYLAEERGSDLFPDWEGSSKTSTQVPQLLQSDPFFCGNARCTTYPIRCQPRRERRLYVRRIRCGSYLGEKLAQAASQLIVQNDQRSRPFFGSLGVTRFEMPLDFLTALDTMCAQVHQMPWVLGSHRSSCSGRDAGCRAHGPEEYAVSPG